MSEPRKRILGLNAMASELGVTTHWLKRRAEDGAFPVEDDGSGRWLFDADVTHQRFSIVSGHGRGGHMCTQLTNTKTTAQLLCMDKDRLLRMAQSGEVPHFILAGEKRTRYLFNAEVLMQLEVVQIFQRSDRAKSKTWRRAAGLPVVEDDDLPPEEAGAVNE